MKKAVLKTLWKIKRKQQNKYQKTPSHTHHSEKHKQEIMIFYYVHTTALFTVDSAIISVITINKHPAEILVIS